MLFIMTLRLLLCRKSQAEAFGLILIVALVFVIFAILTRVEQTRESSDLKSSFEITELSSATMNTFFATYSVQCSSGSSIKTYRDVLIDCIRNPLSTCQNGQSSCDNFRVSARILLNAFFKDIQGLDYFMSFSSRDAMLPEQISNSIPSDIEDTDCSENLRGEDFILPLNPGNVVVRLIVCRPI